MLSYRFRELTKSLGTIGCLFLYLVHMSPHLLMFILNESLILHSENVIIDSLLYMFGKL